MGYLFVLRGRIICTDSKGNCIFLHFTIGICNHHNGGIRNFNGQLIHAT